MSRRITHFNYKFAAKGNQMYKARDAFKGIEIYLEKKEGKIITQNEL